MNGHALATSPRIGSFAAQAAQAKRPRPPLALATARQMSAKTVLELDFETPVDNHDYSPVHTSPYSAASSLSPFFDAEENPLTGDITQDLVVLEQLRRSVQKNLRLRPIRSSPTPPHSPVPPHSPSKRLSTSSTWSDYRSASPSSGIASPSVYFTPTSETHSPPASAHFLGGFNHRFDPSALDSLNGPSGSRAVDPASLASRLYASRRPLLIDTRPLASYLTSRIKFSINVAIPSLILKRSRQSGRGFQSLDAFRQYITTDQGKDLWDDMMRPGSNWDRDLIVFDDEMSERDRNNVQATAWVLLPVLAPLLQGSADYIEGGMVAARTHLDMRPFITAGEPFSPSTPDSPPSSGSRPQTARTPALPPPTLSLPPKPKKGATLPQLDTYQASHAARSRALPEVERSATSASPPQPLVPPSFTAFSIADASPSPPPSQSAFPHPQQGSRRPSLRRIDTKSAERLTVSIPKLPSRTMPVRSATLAAPPGPWPPSSPRAPSPSALNLVHSNHTPPASAARFSVSPASSASSGEFLAPPSPFALPSSPSTPIPPTPRTARVEDQPPSTEEGYPVFTISTILPNFLFLGPELTEDEHVEQLQALGVKRILNLAIECDQDDHGLHLQERFEKYTKIPMRDTVEEENIVRGVREACEILDDAALHSAPTYVHCKAGKSRSVTAVMAYLIHANHWTLSRAYTFVLERRKGISPNIGFVSELMNFEEQELGGKSVGVVKDKEPSSASAGEEGGDGAGGNKQTNNYAAAVVGARRTGHMRESLPPAFHVNMDAIMDVGQETEVKDATGRYRHARRAPVDENTLQPMRRVSKAGLESLTSDM